MTEKAMKLCHSLTNFYQPYRTRWSESVATAAIEDIVADGLEHFDAERFWPAHSLDEEFATATPASILVPPA
jgi:hypothetical protein